MWRVAAQLCHSVACLLLYTPNRMKAMQHDQIRASMQGCTFCSPVGSPAEPGACILREETCGAWLPSCAHSVACPLHYTPNRMKAMQHDQIRASMQGCTFCSPVSGPAEPGACISREGTCDAWLPSYAHSAGCPSPYTAPIIAGLLIYLAAFAPGVGPVPWAVNAELYPQQVRPRVIMLRERELNPSDIFLRNWLLAPG